MTETTGVGWSGQNPSPPLPSAQSPWWSQDAANDPWRNPASQPTWQLPPSPPSREPEAPVSPKVATPPVARFLLLGVIIAVLAGLVGGALGYVAADKDADGGKRSLGGPSGNSELAKRPPTSVAGIVDRVQAAVVTVVISGAQEGNGTGFVITDDGYILTNHHVAAAGQNGGQLHVVFSNGDSYEASVEGADPGSDVAVIKIEKNDLPVLEMGDSDSVRVGDPVVAFGAPLGLAGTVTTGIVSAVDRPVLTGGETGSSVEDEAYMAAVQTDAAINPGNSGGPLVDGGGHVIGVNSAIATAPGSQGFIGIGFAIPINHARRVAEQLINFGSAKTTVMGASLDQSYQAASGGARLRDIEDDGPADKAGLRSGDIVRKFKSRVVDDSVALIALIRKEAANTEVTVEYEREGEMRKAQVTLTDRPS